MGSSSLHMYIYSSFETRGNKKYQKLTSRLMRLRFYFIIKLITIVKNLGLHYSCLTKNN